MKMPFLKVEGLSKVYPGQNGRPDVTVFEDVNFTVDAGEFVCILGHSGCGKTTILNILAGLDEPSGGVVIMAGREISGPSLDRGVVFQNHALLPWLTALENVAFGVRSRHPEWSRETVDEHSLKYLEMVGLGHSAHKKPAELSGGMKQRVGIARAFAIQPRMLLLDEPFGALDALTRGTIQDELLAIVKATQQTVFMITHDVDEAILLADRIILMSNGPNAGIVEFVEVTLPRNRTRATLFEQPGYYAIRNHLLEFLIRRSAEYSREPRHLRKAPPVVRPGVDGGANPPGTRGSAAAGTGVAETRGSGPVILPFHQGYKGELQYDSRRNHGTHPAGQAEAQADVGSSGGGGRQEQGMDDGGPAGADDADRRAGQGRRRSSGSA